MKTCVKCGDGFSGHSRQKRCNACRGLTCEQCGNVFLSINSRDGQRFCGRGCRDASNRTARTERINRNRGIKPRTYADRHRDKHGCAADVEWRKAVFSRDNYTCQVCRAHGVRIQAHHIKAFKSHPELRHELSNGQTLCVPCHKQTDTFGWQAYWKSQIAAERLRREEKPLFAAIKSEQFTLGGLDGAA